LAAMETAYASVSRARIRVRAEKGDKRAERALFVTDHIEQAITTILICTNVVHLAVASVVTVYVTQRFGEAAVTVSTLVTTIAVFLFGEMLPKAAARKFSLSIALFMSGLMCFMMKVLKPAAAALAAIGNAVARLVKKEPEATVTENEIHTIIEDMAEDGAIDAEQGKLISSALQFKDVTAESILTSRVDLDAIDVSMKPDEVLRKIRSVSHSRLPVYEGTIDNIIGVLQIRKFLKSYIESGGKESLREMLDEPYFAHQSTKIDDLLRTMTSKKRQVAVITDNFGGTLGIVTVEDILEELVGEIWDEDDRAVQNVVPLGKNTYSVNAAEHVLDVFDKIGVKYTDKEGEELKNKIMSEIVFEQLPDMPVEGDRFTFLGTEMTVLSMKKSRIYRVQVRVNEGVNES
ncbi:MAG: hemolysin family protein, partial [Lachnospiraceae bacterium]|nr:hemolysin family protein [Lachnospiraceae bacterium]